MRVILQTLAATCLALIVVAIAIFGAGDRSTLVPPPDAVAESFAREVATRRFDLALNYLSREAKRVETPAAIGARFRPALAEAGTVNSVESRELWMRGSESAAQATILGDRGRSSFDVDMVLESGLWKIVRLPDLVR